jgi:hypothetical protein
MPRRSGDAGIYLLANDRFLQWTRALLNSLEFFEPDLPLTLIPYDGNAARVAALVGAHGHAVFANENLLASLDDLAIGSFGPRPGWVGAYRKFAAFSGPYARFLVLDADIVVTGSLLGVFDRLGPDCQLYAAQHTSTADAWREGALRVDAERTGRQPYNSGIWAGMQGGMNLEGLRSLATEARQVRDQFASRGDQSFFNFCIDRFRLPARAWHEDATGPLCAWAGDLPAGPGPRPLPARTAAVHWAGYRLSPLMPRRRLWLHHRLSGVGSVGRAAYIAAEPLRALPEVIRRARDPARVRQP